MKAAHFHNTYTHAHSTCQGFSDKRECEEKWSRHYQRTHGQSFAELQPLHLPSPIRIQRLANHFNLSSSSSRHIPIVAVILQLLMLLPYYDLLCLFLFLPLSEYNNLTRCQQSGATQPDKLLAFTHIPLVSATIRSFMQISVTKSRTPTCF
jgi:hypothetical protein